MLLQDLQTYLKDHHRASLQEISQQLHTDVDALRGMLSQLIRKGRVQKIEGSKCAHCSDCAPEAIEFYEWIWGGCPQAGAPSPDPCNSPA